MASARTALLLRLALLLSLLVASSAKSAIAKRGGPVNNWRSMRTECDKRGACRHLPPTEDEDCLLACQAPPCHELIYKASPLEPGEVDLARGSRFQRCLRELESILRPLKLWPPRLDMDTRALQLPPSGLGADAWVKLEAAASPSSGSGSGSGGGGQAEPGPGPGQAQGELTPEEEEKMVLGG